MDAAAMLIGLFRRFRSIILQREVEIRGRCIMCGNCCRGVLLRDDDRVIKSQRQFEKLCQSDPKISWFENIGKDDFGNLCFACTRRGKDNLCTCYEDRPQLCKDYPTKSLYYQGGWLGSDCGFYYKSVKFRDVFTGRKQLRMPDFADVLKQEQNNKRSSS